MTLDAKEDNKQEGTITTSSSTTQHYTKNPHRTSRDTDHVKPRNTVTFEEKEDSNDSEKENRHESVSQQNSDISRSYENFTLARKEGKPIYAVRANYRFVLQCYTTNTHPFFGVIKSPCCYHDIRSTWLNSVRKYDIRCLLLKRTLRLNYKKNYKNQVSSQIKELTGKLFKFKKGASKIIYHR